MVTVGRARVVAPMVLVLFLAGCVHGVDEYYAFDPDQQYKNPGVFPGQYDFGNGGSTVLVAGQLEPNPQPEVVRLVSTLPAYAAGGELTSDATVQIPMAIWRPANYTQPLPVIVDAGPYYEVFSHGRNGDIPDTIDWPGQSTPFLVKNYLPKGYAVAQVAVRGTGTAGGCMDLMGPAEQHDLDQAITWLGTQPWSNGNVGMIGVSYDGSTPWVVAATGNPHLKTIVPISGLPDIYDLMFHNGTPETRAPLIYGGLSTLNGFGYWGYGFDEDFPQQVPDIPGPPVEPPVPLPIDWPAKPVVGQANDREEYQDLQNLLCPEAWRGITLSQASTATGDRHDEVDRFWADRDHRAGVLANYKGSVFLVHGLQDWNVDPHSAIPFNTELRKAGIPVKEWYGQWHHQRPDSSCAAKAPEWASLPCRLDYADVLGRWFDRYLKDNMTVELGPDIQVEDNLGQWRNAAAYPPTDATWTTYGMGADGKVVPSGAATGTVRLEPGSATTAATILTFHTDVFETDVHLSGMPKLALPFIPQGEGGHMGVWMFDEDPDGKVRAPLIGTFDNQWMPYGTPVVGHAQMNLRYYAGGETMQTLTPGETYVARIQFEPLEVHVPAGHRLTFWVFQGTDNDHQSSMTSAPVDLLLGPDALLHLPVLDLDFKTVFPVPGVHFPDRELLGHMYVANLATPATDSLPGVPVAGGPVAPTGTAPVSGLAASAADGAAPACPAPLAPKDCGA